MHRFLALGDSYTVGEGVGAAECWPAQLAALLRQRGVDVAAPRIVARTGWTTDELAAGIDDAAPVGSYAMVTLGVGVNDQYRGRTVESYRAGLVPLLDRAAELAGGDTGRVVMVSIPDWGVTPFAEGRDRRAIATAIDSFNHAARTEAERRGTRWVDVTPASREPGAALAPDGLHPGAPQYARWAELLLPAALRILVDGSTGGGGA